jgi:hypothetical protein
LSLTRLDALTPEQRQQLPGYRAQKSRIGPTGADREAAERAIAEIYAAGGLAPPERIMWAPSPTALAKDWLAKGGTARAGANVRGAFTGLIDGARNNVFNAVTARVWETAERGTAHAPASTAALGVRNSVVSAVDKLRLGWTLGIRTWFGRGERRAAFRDSSWSLIDALDYNLPAYRYFGEVVSLKGAGERIGALWTLSTSTGWVVPHERVCWLSELPTAVHVDETGRLHSGTEAALRYADGWRVYAWKGIVIPEWIVARPELVTVKAIDRQPNPWIRRCMIEILTPERYIALGGATCVSRDATGKLWRRQWWGPGDDAWAAVEVLNGTAEPDGTFRRYFLQVPANVRTAREAVAWTYGLTDSQYANLVLRT